MKLLYCLFFSIILLLSCQESKPEQEYYVVEKYRVDTNNVQKSSRKASRPGFKYYKNATFNLALEYPKDWNVHESNPDDTIQVINLFPIQDTYSHRFPIILNLNTQLPHVSFYPNGLEKVSFMGLSRPLKGFEKDLPIFFNINKEESSVFLLENLQVYGYLIKPSIPPPGWSKDGFIFVKIAVDGFYFTCLNLNSGIEKPLEDCNPSEGDKLRKYGNLNASSKKAILDIMSSLHFYEDESDPVLIAELINITAPKPFQEVNTPLTVSGAALSSWYNNSEFQVVLADADYQILASNNAKAKQKDSTEEFIPFDVTLDFKYPIHDRGYLILKRANPSGRPEKDRSVVIPVSFPPIQ